MADAPMLVEVVTPEQSLLEEPATAIVLRTSDGDLTVLPGHTPLVADVVGTVVRVEREEGDPLRLAVHGGFLHVDTAPGATSAPADETVDPGAAGEAAGPTGNPASELSTRVRLLAGIAELSDRIDLARAREAKARAEARAAELRAAGVTGTGPSDEAAGEDRVVEVTAEDLALDEAEAAVRRSELRIEVVEGPTPAG